MAFFLRMLTAGFALFVLSMSAVSAQTAGAGEAIYRKGVLPSGTPLRAVRASGGRVEGAAAACMNCHRRSGLGSAEGRFVIPPITGMYLFRPHGSRPEDVDYRYGPHFPPDFTPYNDVTLARAIRDGIGKDGHALNPLMPRFDIDDSAMATLIAYLHELSSAPVPGVTEDTLHFATVVTPDADPVKSQGMLDVLERFFDDKNAFIRGGVRPMRASKTVMYRVTRKWKLHVWRLFGPPDTWERQLQQHLAEEPVFALVSGMGGKTWLPVHRFCERERIPCLMPNVDLPVVAESDFYNIYFSKQVLLEAQLIAHRLREKKKSSAVHRVLQIYREDDIGRQAAADLKSRLAGSGVEVIARPLSGDAQQLAGLLADWKAGDAVVLWLRPSDLAALPAHPAGNTVFVSGLMGGLEHAPLPPAWHVAARIAYPFDLPAQRRVRMNFPLGWFAVRHIRIVDERTQSDTYLACQILAESLHDMLESFVRDYLVEQVEAMLSRRLVNGYYPRLGLAPGQRFASKGGYLVRFAAAEGTQLVADSDWIVP